LHWNAWGVPHFPVFTHDLRIRIEPVLPPLDGQRCQPICPRRQDAIARAAWSGRLSVEEYTVFLKTMGANAIWPED